MTIREALSKIEVTARAAPASLALLERGAVIKRHKQKALRSILI
jgi:hypothetical protein